MKNVKLSATSITALKTCPMKFRLAYVEGIRPIEDTDSQRMGTNWHELHEVYAEYLCHEQSVERRPDIAMHAVQHHLNLRYANVPQSKTAEEWELERQILLTCFVGYQWYWQNDELVVLESERAFDLPIRHPDTGRAVRGGRRVGKIDQIVLRSNGDRAVLERKSTRKSVTPDSDYWEKLQKDTQISMYALAAAEDPTIAYNSVLYDVWHVPTIRPAKLSQKDTKEFVETQAYHGVSFTVHQGEDGSITVDGEPATVEQGKAGVSIRETPAMFSARLLSDIQERPDFYFARRDVVRTDKELRKFTEELYAIHRAQRLFQKNKCWFECGSQCRATFPCPYIALCYGSDVKAVCDGVAPLPAGYRRAESEVKATEVAVD